MNIICERLLSADTKGSSPRTIVRRQNPVAMAVFMSDASWPHFSTMTFLRILNPTLQRPLTKGQFFTLNSQRQPDDGFWRVQTPWRQMCDRQCLRRGQTKLFVVEKEEIWRRCVTERAGTGHKLLEGFQRSIDQIHASDGGKRKVLLRYREKIFRKVMSSIGKCQLVLHALARQKHMKISI